MSANKDILGTLTGAIFTATFVAALVACGAAEDSSGDTKDTQASLSNGLKVQSADPVGTCTCTPLTATFNGADEACEPVVRGAPTRTVTDEQSCSSVADGFGNVGVTPPRCIGHICSFSQ
jgi:hypothetical protein